MKRKIISILMTVVVSISISGCGKNDDKQVDTTKSETKQSSNVTKDTESKDTAETKKDTQGNTKDTASKNDNKDTKKVGQDDYGYVEVPANWVNFKDVDVPDSSGIIQYSDPSGKSIITMNKLGKSQNSLENMAQSMAQKLKSDGAEPTGAKVKIGKYDAYQVYGYYKKEDKMLIEWLFNDEDGNMRFVSAEGPKASVADVVKSVEKTYVLK